jgi:hypothetical protein
MANAGMLQRLIEIANRKTSINQPPKQVGPQRLTAAARQVLQQKKLNKENIQHCRRLMSVRSGIDVAGIQQHGKTYDSYRAAHSKVPKVHYSTAPTSTRAVNARNQFDS